MSAIAATPTNSAPNPDDRAGQLGASDRGTAGAPAGRAPVRIPLTQLSRGDRAIVELGGLAQDESRLLNAMGLADKCEVRVCKSGGVCIVQVEATRLGISADMAARILATPCACYPEADAERAAKDTPATYRPGH